MTHPADALWFVGAAFLGVLVLTGTVVPLWAALFYRVDERTTRLELWLVRFGRGLLVVAMVVVGSFAVGFAIVVMTRVWRLT